jgi:GcrA cell cycle regulator
MQTQYAAEMWSTGRSASQIASGLLAEYGIERTRNSVIGKLNKMGLIGTRAYLSRQRATQRRRVSDLIADARGRVGQFGEPQALPPDEPIPASAVELDDRRPHQCCWPVNHGGPFLYCGAVKAPGDKRFCCDHANRAVRRR